MTTAGTISTTPDSAAHVPRGFGAIEHIRHEAVLAVGALPLLLGHFGPVFKMFEFGGWADTLVTSWAPIMNAISSVIVLALGNVLSVPIAAPYRPLVAVVVQLGAVLYFAFRRFGTAPYFVRAFAKFGLPQTVGHYAVHLLACVVLLMFIAAASSLPLQQFVQVPLDAAGFSDASAVTAWPDRALTLLVSGLAGVLFVWHPGVGVRLLALLLALLAFDFLTGALELAITSPES